jgi:hypothetical protein
MKTKNYVIMTDNNYWYSTLQNATPEQLEKELIRIKDQSYDEDGDCYVIDCLHVFEFTDSKTFKIEEIDEDENKTPMKLYWISDPMQAKLSYNTIGDSDYDDYTQFKIAYDDQTGFETFGIMGNTIDHDDILKFLSTPLKEQKRPENGTGLSFLIVTWAERMRSKGHYIEFQSLAELKEKLELAIYLTEQI